MHTSYGIELWYNEAMNEAAIHTERLNKEYLPQRTLRQNLRNTLGRIWPSDYDDEPVLAVRDLSLTVHAGELYSLLGPNGAGKTTLIRLLCTMIVPTSGTGSIFGVDLAHSNQIRQMIGMATGEERSFYWRLSGRHNLEFFAALYGLKPAHARQRITELLRQVDLTSHADRPFRTYSSGQKQRLGIARALLHHPRLLFLDEPTRSLDPTATLRLHEFIEQELLQNEQMTILLTTHRLDEAARLSHRIGIMHKGHLQAEGTPDELRSRLGAAILYTLQVDGLALDPRTMAAELPGRLGVERLGEGQWHLVLEAVDSETALPLLLNRLIAAGGQVRSVQRSRPSLDQVFQRFTEAV
ncbi:MAG: ABC transporter ATP-binding protein [Caldilineales bacterium]